MTEGFGARLIERSGEQPVERAGELFGARVAEDSDAFRDFSLEVTEEVRAAAAIPDEAVLAALPPEARTRSAGEWAWVHASLQAIDQHFTWAGDRLLATFTRDVWLYLTAPGLRDEIDDLVSAMLDADPTVVVGHSLGSVVTYSVLKRRQGLTVPRYVTLGSPLGLTAIRRRFAPLRFPAGVDEWFNAYDPRDVVALRPLDATTWPVEPAIRNKGDVVNWTDNRHGIAGYLTDPEVARAIATHG